MKTIEIKDKNNALVYATPINEGSIRKFMLMSEDYLLVKFSLKTPIMFTLGCYADTEYGRFEITDLQKPTYNDNTDGYDYDLRLDASYWKLKNKIFRYTPEYGGQEASWSLTASLDVHLGIVLRNISALGYTCAGEDYEWEIDSTVNNKAKTLTYNNTSILDALFSMAKEWDCDCWFEGNKIKFGRCEKGEHVDLEIGKTAASMSRTDGQNNYATRLYVFGSTRNIPTNYRPAESSQLLTGVVEKRLMLPAGTPYVDAYEGMTNEEAVEEVVVFDDVYPRRVGTITGAVPTETDVLDENNNPTGETNVTYRFTDTAINFSTDYLLDNSDAELRMVFQSGLLNGMDFGVKFNPDGAREKDGEAWLLDAQVYEIVPNEDYGRRLPDNTLKPQSGDTYVLYGWDSTKIGDMGYVTSAEQELLTEARNLLATKLKDTSTYTVTAFSDFSYGLHPASGQLDSQYGKMLTEGQKVRLINASFFNEPRETRVLGYEYKLDKPYDSPVYTIGETTAYSRIAALEEKLSSSTLNGSGLFSSQTEAMLKRITSGANQSTTENIQVTTDVGYYKNGDVILSGTEWEKIIKNMLYKAKGAELTARLSTPNDVEYGTAKGFITYSAVRNGNGNITQAYYDGNENNTLTFGAELNGIRTAVRQLSGQYTARETHTATVSFAGGKTMSATTLTSTISVNVKRKWFAGVVSSQPTTSAHVRGLASSGLFTVGDTLRVNVGKWKMIAVCIPDGTISEMSVSAYSGNFIDDAGVTTGAIDISVEGANGSAATNYKMWIIKTAGENDADTLTIKTIGA